MTKLFDAACVSAAPATWRKPAGRWSARDTSSSGKSANRIVNLTLMAQSRRQMPKNATRGVDATSPSLQKKRGTGGGQKGDISVPQSRARGEAQGMKHPS